MQEQLRIDHAGERRDVAIDLQRIRHCEAIGVARDGYDVRRLEDRRLLEDLLSNFAEREAIRGRIEVIQSAGALDRLERYATDASLIQRLVDDLADLVVVQSLLQCDDERGGNVAFVQTVVRAFAYVGKFFTAQLRLRFGL